MDLRVAPAAGQDGGEENPRDCPRGGGEGKRAVRGSPGMPGRGEHGFPKVEVG